MKIPITRKTTGQRAKLLKQLRQLRIKKPFKRAKLNQDKSQFEEEIYRTYQSRLTIYQNNKKDPQVLLHNVYG